MSGSNTICVATVLLETGMLEAVEPATNLVLESADRSPCGTGTCARMAVIHARGELAVGERFIHTSIIDSRFDCRIESTTTVGGVPAIVPAIAGQAWITDLTTIVLDPTDPYPEGCRLTDTWPTGLPS